MTENLILSASHQAILDTILQIKSENNGKCLVSNFDIQAIAVKQFPDIHMGDPMDVNYAKGFLVEQGFLSESDFQ